MNKINKKLIVAILLCSFFQLQTMNSSSKSDLTELQKDMQPVIEELKNLPGTDSYKAISMIKSGLEEQSPQNQNLKLPAVSIKPYNAKKYSEIQRYWSRKKILKKSPEEDPATELLPSVPDKYTERHFALPIINLQIQQAKIKRAQERSSNAPAVIIPPRKAQDDTSEKLTEWNYIHDLRWLTICRDMNIRRVIRTEDDVHNAIRQNDETQALQLMQDNPAERNVNAVQKHHPEALIVKAEIKKMYNLVHYLRSQHANIYVTDMNPGYTPLCMAIKNNDQTRIDYWLKSFTTADGRTLPAQNINAGTIYSYTRKGIHVYIEPLLFQFLNNQQILALLLNLGARIDVFSNQGETPLCHCITHRDKIGRRFYQGLKDEYRQLQLNEFQRLQRVQNRLNEVIAVEQKAIIELLIEHGAKCDEKTIPNLTNINYPTRFPFQAKTVLDCAVETRSIETIKMLLETYHDFTPEIVASAFNILVDNTPPRDGYFKDDQARLDHNKFNQDIRTLLTEYKSPFNYVLK